MDRKYYDLEVFNPTMGNQDLYIGDMISCMGEPCFEVFGFYGESKDEDTNELIPIEMAKKIIPLVKVESFSESSLKSTEDLHPYSDWKDTEDFDEE